MKYRIPCFQIIRLVPVLLILFACNNPKPPIAEKIASRQVIHGVDYTDPYKYLENPKDPQTVSYIRAENEYAEHYFGHLSKLKNKLLNEFEGQYDYEKKSGSIPELIGEYYYYRKIPDGKNFPVHYRKLKGENAKEELLLDENLLAQGALNFKMDQFLVSPDNSKFLYTYAVNSNMCRLLIKNLDDQPCSDSITGDISCPAWAGNGKSVVYVKDKKEVLVHQIGKPVVQDKTIFSETRDDLFVDVNLSESAKYIFISSYNNESAEYSYLPADLKSLKPTMIESLKKGHRYVIEHFGSDFFLILSDKGTPNRKLFKAFISKPSEQNWTTVLENKDSIYIAGYSVVDQRYLLLTEKKNLNASLRLVDLSYGGKDNLITFKEPDGHIEFLYYDKDEQKIVFSFASILTPVTVYAYNLDSRKLTIRRRPSIKDYIKENYIVDLMWATSNDGTKIPISMIHKKGTRQSDGTNPLILETYGRYGYAVAFDFNPAMISLLNRGFFLACAHVRGGEDPGKPWLETGKLMKIKNAIADYIACADYLIKQGYTNKGMITACGSSTGGIVIGAAMNERPDLFKSALLIMPDVDPIHELNDSAKSKGNTNEKSESGKPKTSEQVRYLLGYSPYDNIKKQEYPAMFFRTSIQDQNIDFSGPLKMGARLRANKTDKNILLIKTNEHQLHLGDKGMREDNESRAENWVFILDQYGIRE